jgi:plasmid stability protein
MTMIQVRNVPAGTHRELKARAARQGVSLSDYVRRLIDEDLAVPTLEEALARIAELPRPRRRISGADEVRRARETRERTLIDPS